MTPPLPERIGRFRVVGLLGQGAMGVVYRGRDDLLERDVALKVMASAALAGADNRERFLREARASARLQHPNIVTIYELGEHEGQPFMALELLEGLDLQRAIERGIRPDPKVILPVVLQMLAGLGHAHAHGVVHRDVKPSNVFIPLARPVKIMDFGVARLAATTLTSAGTVLGTPAYMSPEQVRGEEVDGRSDLFSAGLILYELLTGEKVFHAGSVVAVLYKVAHEPPDLSLLPRGGPWSGLRAVIERVLARDPATRHPDAAALSQDLVRALQALGGTPEWSLAPDLSLLTLATPRPRSSPADTWRAAPTHAAVTQGGEPQTPLAGMLTDLPLVHGHGGPPAAADSLELRRRSGATAEMERSVPEHETPRARPGRRSPAALPLALAAVALVALLALLATRGRRPAAPAPTLPVPTADAPGVVPAAPSPTAALPSPAAPPPVMPARTPAPRVVATPRPPAPATPAEAPPESNGRTTPVEARLERAERLLEQGRYASALSEARAALARAPDSEQARDIIQEAEALLLVEASLQSAREAWRRGDREATRSELRKGLAVRPEDARLLALWREITR